MTAITVNGGIIIDIKSGYLIEIVAQFEIISLIIKPIIGTGYSIQLSIRVCA